MWALNLDRYLRAFKHENNKLQMDKNDSRNIFIMYFNAPCKI